ncbi:ABC transporter permease [Actinomarinicola tropica]|nr:ABC transporter permease [Actinomarinicola tropica]
MTGGLARAGAIGAVNLRRHLRDRGNLFFTFVFPIAMILVIGLQFGSSVDPRLGVVGADSDLAAAVLAELDDGETDVEVVDVADLDAGIDQVESADLDAVVAFPDGVDASLLDGDVDVEVELVAAADAQGQELRTLLDGALSRASAPAAAARAAAARGADPTEAAAAAAGHVDALDRVAVRTVTAGDRIFPEGTGGFDVAGPSMLVLFVFVNGLAGSYALIVSRQLGISRRMLSTPTSSRSIILGEGLGRFVIGIVQGAYILVATLLLFDIEWGGLLGATAIVVAVAAVAAAAAMIFGTFFSNPEQASGIGVVASLALGALGGAMMPIELFSDTLAAAARFTPHYWAIDAFAELIRHDGGLADIWSQLAVLLAIASVLLVIASWRMRQVLTRTR